MLAYSKGLFFTKETLAIQNVEASINAKNPLLVILNAFSLNFLSTLSNNGNIIAVVVISIVLGIIFQQMKEQVSTLKKLIDEVNEITKKCLNFVILKLSPIGIFSLLIRTFAQYGITYLIPALVYMLITTLALLIILFIIFPLLVWYKAKIKPQVFIKKVYKVAIFAFSTSSSAASLPLAQKTVTEDFNIKQSTASFVVPLASTINMTGTAIMQVIATLFIAACANYDIGLMQIISILLLTVVGSISTPAAPGAGAILLFTIISGMGFVNPAAIAAYSLIIAINRPVEMLVTAVNVVDDVVSSLMFENSLKEKQVINDIVLERV